MEVLFDLPLVEPEWERLSWRILSFRSHDQEEFWVIYPYVYLCTYRWKCLSIEAPSRSVPFLSVLLPRDVIWRQAVTSHCNVTQCHCNIAWCQLTSQSEYAQVNRSETLQTMFFNVATLTYDLDLWIQRYCLGEPLHKILGLSVKWFSRDRANRWWTDGHTDGTDFIPPTADVGGKIFNIQHTLQNCSS